MINISVETYESNGVEPIIDNNGTWWLNKKYIGKVYMKKKKTHINQINVKGIRMNFDS